MEGDQENRQKMKTPIEGTSIRDPLIHILRNPKKHLTGRYDICRATPKNELLVDHGCGPRTALGFPLSVTDSHFCQIGTVTTVVIKKKKKALPFGLQLVTTYE